MRNKADNRGLFEREKGSGIWSIRYTDREGHRRKEVVGIKSRARELYQQRKTEVRLAREAPATAASGVVLFREIADDALKYSERHSTKGYKNEIFRRNRMCQWWGELEATALTPQQIELRFDSMTREGHNQRPETRSRPVSNGTLNRYRAQLSLAYQLAQKHAKVPIGFNPARLVPLRRERHRMRWLSAEEEQRLRVVLARDYPDKPWLAVLDLALNCGLRWGDQAGLTCENRDGNMLRVEIAKTDEPLALQLNDIAEGAFGLLEETSATDGKPLNINKSPRRWFERACRLAGIRNFRWHDLRHTFATRLLQAGVPAEKVQRLLGHRTITMALRYAHVVEAYHDDALNRLAEINQRCAQGGAQVLSIEKQREKDEIAQN
jgi:integrase